MLDPTNMEIGRRVSFMVTGRIGRCEAIVTTKRDKYGWHILKIDAPAGHPMLGVELKCEDYVPCEYVETV